MPKKIEAVDVNFKSILQARLIADGLPLASYLDDWFESVIASKKSKVLKKLITGFDNLLDSQQLNNVIQFNISSLDKNLILYFFSNIDKLDSFMNEKYNHHIKIYSENSFVDAGFISLHSKSFDYYGTATNKINHENIIFEYNPLYKQGYLKEINDLQNHNSNVKIISDDGPKFLLTSDFDLKTQPYFYRTFFIDPRNDRKLPFNGFSFHNHSSTELSLIPNSAEAVLQLSAAYESDYWLLFSTGYGGKFYIFKLPDLSDNSTLHRLWSSRLLETNGFMNYEKDLGYRSLDKVSLDIHLSIECSKLFNWFLPKDPEIIPHYINLLN